MLFIYITFEILHFEQYHEYREYKNKKESIR
jgi:hypothetical protein